jgi:hypothetical protein
MATPEKPHNHAHFRVRESLWFAADLVNDPLLNLPDDKKPDALIAIAQMIAIESVSDSLADISKQITALSDKLGTTRAK